MLALNDVINQMCLADIYRSFHPNTKKKYASFLSTHRTCSKIDHILGHKPQQIQQNWDNALHLIWPLLSKTVYHQQQKQKIYKLMYTEELNTEWKLGQDKKSRMKLRTFGIEWKWKYNIPKPMQHNEGGSKTQVHSTKYLHQKTG